jgi:uncharacterized membrane protein
MITYYLVLFLAIAVGYLFLQRSDRDSASCRFQYVIVVSLLFALQSGLRHANVGADTQAYYIMFTEAQDSTWDDVATRFSDVYINGIGKDGGYDVFQWLASFICPSYQCFLLLIAGLFFIALGTFVYRNTASLADCMIALVLYSCLFYSFYSITGHRQTVATSGALLGYELIKQRRLVWFVLLMTLMATIHASCLVFIPMYWLYSSRYAKILLVGSLILCPILLATGSQVLTSIKTNIAYSDYHSQYDGLTPYTFTLLIVTTALVSLWRIGLVTAMRRDTSPYFIALAMAIVTTPLVWFDPNAMRVVQYYSLFLLVLIPAVANSFSNQSHRGIRFEPLCALLIILVALSVKGESYVGYKFFWQAD